MSAKYLAYKLPKNANVKGQIRPMHCAALYYLCLPFYPQH